MSEVVGCVRQVCGGGRGVVYLSPSPSTSTSLRHLVGITRANLGHKSDIKRVLWYFYWSLRVYGESLHFVSLDYVPDLNPVGNTGVANNHPGLVLTNKDAIYLLYSSISHNRHYLVVLQLIGF